MQLSAAGAVVGGLWSKAGKATSAELLWREQRYVWVVLLRIVGADGGLAIGCVR